MTLYNWVSRCKLHRNRLSNGLKTRTNEKAATCIMQVAANYFMIIYYLLSESIVDEQEDAQNIERKIQILELTHHHLDEHIAQDAEADAIGDAVAEHHRNHRDEGRE